MWSLPSFPDFAPLELAHRASIEAALTACSPVVSELSFAEMFAWRGVRHTEVAQIDGTPCLRLIRHGQRRVYPPLAPGDQTSLMRQLLRWEHEQGADAQVFGLTAEQAALASIADDLQAQEDPDDADYVYRSSDLIHLAGRHYDGKRNHIANFEKDNEYELVAIDAAILPEVEEFQRRWWAIRGRPEVPSMVDENRAVSELLQHFTELSVVGAAIRIRGQVESFSVASELNPDTALVIAEKGNPQFRGIYQVINQLACQRMLARYTWINREQDAGDPGLRRAKLSYHPHHLQAKYQLRLTSSS